MPIATFEITVPDAKQAPESGNQPANATFSLTLKGVRAGFTAADAVAKLALLFKASPAQVEKILALPRYPLKTGLTFEAGKKYQRAIEDLGGACELVCEQEITGLNLDILPATIAASADQSGATQTDKGQGQPPGAATVASAFTDSLQILREKINLNNAYLGMMIGVAVFAFSLFLTWASIPTGIRASDGGTFNGWQGYAFLALLPLLFALHPVIRKQPVKVSMLLINVCISFGLLGYNNVLHRPAWYVGYGKLGSDLGVGFWIGLLAMVLISVCGTAWALHTTEPGKSPT